MTHVQGHKVRNPINFAADCAISFKVGTEFYHGTADILQMFKVKGQGHNVKGHNHNVSQGISSKKMTATDTLDHLGVDQE